MKDTFYKFIKEVFEKSKLAVDMAKTVEASPWHREDNVWIHTEMVLSEFELIQDNHPFNDTAAYVARLALLFHDTGKPRARTRKESVERGVYHSYPGHEQMSARELENFVMHNEKLMSKWFGSEANYYLPIYAAVWLIEWHLPYDLKNDKKRSAMARSAKGIEDRLHAPGLFAAVLRADARGRISDDKPAKLQKVEDWIAEFYALPEFKS